MFFRVCLNALFLGRADAWVSLSARLTVAMETPKSRAISRIVIGKLSAMVFSYAAKLVIIIECVTLFFGQNIKTECKRLHLKYDGFAQKKKQRMFINSNFANRMK